MKNYTLYLVLLFLAGVAIGIRSEFNHRSKRFLTFYRRNSAVVQLIASIGIPVELELESVTTGFALKSNFILPMNVSDFWTAIAEPFEPNKLSTLDKRSIVESDNIGYDIEQNEKYERHEANVDVIESGTEKDANDSDDSDDSELSNNFATMRWLLYKSLAELATKNGMAGRPCVLRSICESAHTSFDYSNGILGELMHVVMSPSVTNEQITDQLDYEYLYAERLGKEGAPCQQVFSECKTSILDQFTGIYTK